MVFLPQPSTELIPFLEQLRTELWLRPQHRSWEAFLPRGMKPLPCHMSVPPSSRDKQSAAPPQGIKPQP